MWSSKMNSQQLMEVMQPQNQTDLDTHDSSMM